MGIATYGSSFVDWEQRIDLSAMRDERRIRLTAKLEQSPLGALLSFDFANIRYMTSTHIGTWGIDKLIRFALLTRDGQPIVWDFGSAARHFSWLMMAVLMTFEPSYVVVRVWFSHASVYMALLIADTKKRADAAAVDYERHGHALRSALGLPEVGRVPLRFLPPPAK